MIGNLTSTSAAPAIDRTSNTRNADLPNAGAMGIRAAQHGSDARARSHATADGDKQSSSRGYVLDAVDYIAGGVSRALFGPTREQLAAAYKKEQQEKYGDLWRTVGGQIGDHDCSLQYFSEDVRHDRSRQYERTRIDVGLGQFNDRVKESAYTRAYGGAGLCRPHFDLERHVHENLEGIVMAQLRMSETNTVTADILQSAARVLFERMDARKNPDNDHPYVKLDLSLKANNQTIFVSRPAWGAALVVSDAPIRLF